MSSATTISRPFTTPPELFDAAALRRFESLASRYGADSPQVQSLLMRWAAIQAAHRPAPAPVVEVAPLPVHDPESMEAVLAAIEPDEHVTVTGLDGLAPRTVFAAAVDAGHDELCATRQHMHLVSECTCPHLEAVPQAEPTQPLRVVADRPASIRRFPAYRPTR